MQIWPLSSLHIPKNLITRTNRCPVFYSWFCRSSITTELWLMKTLRNLSLQEGNCWCYFLNNSQQTRKHTHPKNSSEEGNREVGSVRQEKEIQKKCVRGRCVFKECVLRNGRRSSSAVTRSTNPVKQSVSRLQQRELKDTRAVSTQKRGNSECFLPYLVFTRQGRAEERHRGRRRRKRRISANKLVDFYQ